MTTVTPWSAELLALATEQLRGKAEYNEHASIPPQPVVYIPAMPVAVRDFILTRLAAKPDEEGTFIQDMADSLDEITATPRQREIYKATLRHAISFAKVKASKRLSTTGEPEQ